MRVSSISKFITIFTVLSTLLVPTLPASLGISQVLAQTQDARKQEADKLFQQGVKQYENRQLDAAFNSFQKTLTLYQQIKDEQGVQFVTVSLKILALDYFSQSYKASREENHQKAIEYSQKHLAIGKLIDDKFIQMEALGNLGAAYLFREDYIQAIDYIQQSFIIAKELKNHPQNPSRIGEKRALINLITAFFSLGEYEQAISYNKELLKLSQELRDDNLAIAGIQLIGGINFERGEYNDAIVQYEKALNIARKLKERYSEAILLSALADAYFGTGNFTKAIQYLKQSITITKEFKDSHLEATSLNSLGFIYTALGDYNQGITKLQRSLELARANKSSLGEAQALHNLGFALYRSGNLIEAEKSLRAAIDIWESERVKLGQNDAYKVSIFEQQAVTYQLLQKILIVQNKSTEALEIAERGRARAFVELLNQQIGINTTAEPNIKPPNIDQIKQIAKEQNATIVEYSIIYDNPKLFISQGHKALEKNQATELYIWVIKPTGEITFRSVNLESLNTPFTKFISNSRESIGARGRATITSELKLNPAKTRANLQKLHNLLIKPIADILPKNPNDRVIFIPQGSLFLVPFPALQDVQGKYLIEKHTILTAPSIQVLDLTRQQKLKLGNKQPGVENSEVLIVGNPTMPEVILEPGKPAQRLNPLPGAKKEAQNIASMFKTQSLTGDAATERKIRQLMPKADIIHFATHGLFDGYRGLGSSLAFAPSEEKSGFSQRGVGESDGLFTAEEILNLYAPPKGTPLRAQMVVLSACDTGRGRITGDGVIGLSRSLISAGVPSVVVSLWAVPDNSTAFLMTEFYQNLQQKHDKATALRKAMLSAKEKYTNPLQWAAFTLIGEAE